MRWGEGLFYIGTGVKPTFSLWSGSNVQLYLAHPHCCASLLFPQVLHVEKRILDGHLESDYYSLKESLLLAQIMENALTDVGHAVYRKIATSE